MASEAGTSDQVVTHGPGRKDEQVILAEPRWPVALAILTFIAISVALRIALPNRESLGPRWLVPGIEFGLLACLVAPIRRTSSGGGAGCAGSRSRWSSRSRPPRSSRQES